MPGALTECESRSGERCRVFCCDHDACRDQGAALARSNRRMCDLMRHFTWPKRIGRVFVMLPPQQAFVGG